MLITGCVALVTGANRPNGMGRAFVEELLGAGAKKVYATARDPEQLEELKSLHPDQIIPIGLDITDQAQVAAVAARASDINLLINNAGLAKYAGFLAADDLEAARAEMEVNYFGTLSMIRAFAPVLKANGGGTIVNMASIVSFANIPLIGSYSASKAALRSMTQGVRAEMVYQFTRVIGVYPGPVDTDMAADFDIPGVPPAQIVKAVLQAITEGREEVFPDQMSIDSHAQLMKDPGALEYQFAEMLPVK